MKVIETERLILRTWENKDIDPMAQIDQDPKVCEHLPAIGNRSATEALIKHIMRHYEQHGFSLYAVELKATHELIGFLGLMIPSFEAHFMPAVEIGWRLSSKHWGQGYATEGATAVLDYAFNQLGLKEIVSLTVPANVRSIRVMEKIGMKRDISDNFHHPKLPSNHPLSMHVLYRITKNNKEINFKALHDTDIPIVKKWFNEPHVVQFYSLRDNWTDEQVAKKFRPFIKQEKSVQCFIVSFKDLPVGFIQKYPIKEFPWPEQEFSDEVMQHAAGIDLFIGEVNYINQGLGTRIIREFLDQHIWNHFSYCIADPNIQNKAMIRCLEKIGFREHKVIQTEDKLMHAVKLKLMILPNPRFKNK